MVNGQTIRFLNGLETRLNGGDDCPPLAAGG